MESTLMEKGYRVSGPVMNMAAVGAANAVLLYRVSNFAQQIGTKSFKPKKLRIKNNGAGNAVISLGTGIAGLFAAAMPAVYSLNGMDTVIDDLPSVELFADMTAYPDVVGGGSIDIQVEVEEIG